jgi:hypothetical protein
MALPLVMSLVTRSCTYDHERAGNPGGPRLPGQGIRQHERIREAAECGWLGEIEGLQVSLQAAVRKPRRSAGPAPAEPPSNSAHPDHPPLAMTAAAVGTAIHTVTGTPTPPLSRQLQERG